jgi:hypothetical protein
VKLKRYLKALILTYHYNKAEKKVNRMPNVLTSKTTQNVAVSGISVAALLAVLRKFFPDALPWDSTQDPAIDSVIMVVLVPLFSRLLAKFRGQLKKDEPAAKLTPLVILFMACSMLWGGCTTTASGAGITLESTVDANAAATAAQIATVLGDVGISFAERLYALQAERDAARSAQERADRVAEIQKYTEILQGIIAAVQDAQEAAK